MVRATRSPPSFRAWLLLAFVHFHGAASHYEAVLLAHNKTSNVPPAGAADKPAYWPFNTKHKIVRVQSVYRAAELRAAGIVPGAAITAVGLMVGHGEDSPSPATIHGLRLGYRWLRAAELAGGLTVSPHEPPTIFKFNVSTLVEAASITPADLVLGERQKLSFQDSGGDTSPTVATNISWSGEHNLLLELSMANGQASRRSTALPRFRAAGGGWRCGILGGAARSVYARVMGDACWDGIPYPWTQLSNDVDECPEEARGRRMEARCAWDQVLDISLWVAGDERPLPPSQPPSRPPSQPPSRPLRSPPPPPRPPSAPMSHGCDPNPCEAGGACVPVPPSNLTGGAGYVCRCPAGRSGFTCEQSGGGGLAALCWLLGICVCVSVVALAVLLRRHGYLRALRFRGLRPMAAALTRGEMGQSLVRNATPQQLGAQDGMSSERTAVEVGTSGMEQRGAESPPASAVSTPTCGAGGAASSMLAQPPITAAPTLTASAVLTGTSSSADGAAAPGYGDDLSNEAL